MIDRILIGNKPETEILFRDDYSPEDVVVSADLMNPEGTRLIALIPPWHGGGVAYEHLARRLVKQGNAVLKLVYDDQILTHDREQVLASFETATSRTAELLQKHTTSGSYEVVTLMAASLGTPALAMTASKFENFHAVTMITPATNLALAMWHGERTQRIRRELESQGETLESVDQTWQPIAPVNRIEALQSKSVDVTISTTDKIIPTQYQLSYVEALASAGVNVNIKYSKLGHYGTIGRYCLLGDLSEFNNL